MRFPVNPAVAAGALLACVAAVGIDTREPAPKIAGTYSGAGGEQGLRQLLRKAGLE